MEVRESGLHPDWYLWGLGVVVLDYAKERMTWKQ